MRPRIALNVRLAAFTAAGNLIGGAHMPFFPSWMESKGLSATDIGLVIALMGVIRVVTGPMISFAADAAERQRVTIILLSGSAVASYAAYFWASDFIWILAWSLTTSAAWSAISPLFESITLRSAQAQGFEYGRVRLWGTAAFVAANLLSGQLVQAYGIDVFLPFITTAGLITFLAAWGVPQLPALRQAATPKRDQAKTAFRLALHPVFILFVLAAAAAQAQHGFYYGFATLDWKAQGYSASLAGVLWAIGPIAEIVLFWYGASVRRAVSPAMLLAIAGASGVVKWTVMALQPPLWVLFPLQILHAGTFAAAHLGAMQFILRAVPPGLAATGQAVYASITYGVVMAGAQFLSGQLFHAYGSAGYLAMSALGAISLLLSLWLVRAWSGRLLLQDGSDPNESDRDPGLWPPQFEADGAAGSGPTKPGPSPRENDGGQP
jgi:PPP family 3-phenylpropionic acid transporter